MAASRLYDDDVLVIGLGRFGARRRARAAAPRAPGHRRRARPRARRDVPRQGQPSRPGRRQRSRQSVADLKAAQLPARRRRHRLVGRGLGARARPTSSTPASPRSGPRRSRPSTPASSTGSACTTSSRPRPTAGAAWPTCVNGKLHGLHRVRRRLRHRQDEAAAGGDRFHVGAEPDPQQVRRDGRRASRRPGRTSRMPCRRPRSPPTTRSSSAGRRTCSTGSPPAPRRRAEGSTASERGGPAVLAERQHHGDLVLARPRRCLTRIGRRLSVGRKPKPLANATARPLSDPTQ